MTCRKVAQRHGMKQNNSVRTSYLDNLAARGPEEQLLKSIERWPVIASAVGFTGIGGWHPSFVEAAIIHDLKAFCAPAKERVRLLKLLCGGLAACQELEVTTPPGLLPLQSQCRSRKADSKPGSFQPAFQSASPCVARFHGPILPVG